MDKYVGLGSLGGILWEALCLLVSPLVSLYICFEKDLLSFFLDLSSKFSY